MRRWNQPEQAVGGNSGTVIVDLLQQTGRSDRTGVKVHSNENKRAVVMLAIFSYKLALHETHVGLKRQRGAEASAVALTEDMDPADEAVEIGDLRRVINFA